MGDEVVENKGTGSYFLGQFAHLGLSVKHVALGTTKLVWLLKGHHHCHVHRIRHILHSKLIVNQKILPCYDNRRSSTGSQWGEHRWGEPAAGSGVPRCLHLQGS